MMELVNDLYAFTEKQGNHPSPPAAAVAREAIESLIVMLSPFAPHTAEELWEQYGHGEGISKTSWPAFDAKAAKAEEIVIPVQVNGKVRARLSVPASISDAELERLALADPGVQPYIAGKTVKKVVIAAGRLLSIVVG
jgi:leucyl-tRNA synthetase